MKPSHLGIGFLGFFLGVAPEIITEELFIYLLNGRCRHFVKGIVFIMFRRGVYHRKQDSRNIEHGCSRAEFPHIDQAAFVALNHDIVDIEVTVNAGVSFGNKVKETI